MEALLIGLRAVVSLLAAGVIGYFFALSKLGGETKYKLARETRIAAYRVRDEFARARRGFIAAGEFPPDANRFWEDRTPEQKAEDYLHILRRRWKPLEDATRELEARAPEVEVTWGTRERERVNAVIRCLVTLQIAGEEFVHAISSWGVVR